jgi:acetate---CoA ligase (ADP-forming)
MPAIKIRYFVWEDSMGFSQRSWAVDRRTILKTSAAIAAVQVTSPFIIRARGETPVRIDMVDPLTGVYAAIAQGEVVGAKFVAVKIAKQIGFPVVAKAFSAEILHKSDIGGVVLNTNSAAEVKKAFTNITTRVKKLKNKPKLERTLIAQQVKADLELVVGASLDAEMGSVVLFGTSGVDIELMKDVALAGAPLDTAEAKQLIGRTKAGVKLRGYRGKPALHEASVVKAIVGLSNLMADAGTRIASIDVNPFLVNTKAGVGVDGLIVLNNTGR